jgi:hypothetical protein
MRAACNHAPIVCRGLVELNLGWCEGITEVGLEALAEHCQDLRVLDLCGCIKVPLFPLSPPCPTSVHVYAPACLGIASASLNENRAGRWVLPLPLDDVQMAEDGLCLCA